MISAKNISLTADAQNHLKPSEHLPSGFLYLVEEQKPQQRRSSKPQMLANIATFAFRCTAPSLTI